MEYVMAPSYRDYETVGTPIVRNGKMYTKARIKCDRCGGLGIIASRVENGAIVPIPIANGVCFKCSGSKYIYKEVRLYTVEEATKMEQRNEAARIKRQQEQEKKMKEKYAAKKEKWLEDNGFSAEGVTYVAAGDTYPIKDELKAAGFIFSPVLKWHKAELDSTYECIPIKVEDIVEFSAWGTGCYKLGAGDLVNERLNATLPQSNSEWVGEIGARITTTVTFVKKHGFMGRFGPSTVYTFEDNDGNLFTWFSTVEVKKEIGETFILTGTVKEHSEYKGTKSTVLSRCKIKEVE